RLSRAVFTHKEVEAKLGTNRLTLEDTRIRALAMRLPTQAPGQPIPIVSIPGLAREIAGFWSLWRIEVTTVDWKRHRIMPIFLSDDGRVLLPTGRYIWDHLLSASPTVLAPLDMEASKRAYERL